MSADSQTLFAANHTANGRSNPFAPIPFDQSSATADKKYQGDSLYVSAAPDGARLRCMFQQLEGHATSKGLWLTSTVENGYGEWFQVVAVLVGRAGSSTSDAGRWPVTSGDALDETLWQAENSPFSFPIQTAFSTPLGESPELSLLPRIGTVAMQDQLVHFVRPGLTEEYSVSMDGVRQDFVIWERPGGIGRLFVQLDVTGAKVEPLVKGARLVLDRSGRRIDYCRLRVTDATGKELTARMEVKAEATRSPRRLRAAETEGRNERVPVLTVVVEDAKALYPIHIDPTFSDANWISMGGLPGADGSVYAAVTDSSGNLYIGGDFITMGQDTTVNYIAKWNGSSWSALGSGMSGGTYPRVGVMALAVSGSDVYAGGYFTTAGGSAANRIAKWNGSTWTNLGPGLDSSVVALAVSGDDVYAGGSFTTAGGSAANRIAKWNGSTWTNLGSGLNNGVYALAVSGDDVYAGGYFTTAGDSAATYIAKWNGTSWSALGSGMNNYVNALAVSGSDIYAGGSFTTAGGSAATYIAKWNGSTWADLGSGMNDAVTALVVSGTNLYVGGGFRIAGNVAAGAIAKWDRNRWSVLGVGMDGPNTFVEALAVSGSNLYAGGFFLMADSGAVNNVAKWDGSVWTALGTGLNNAVSALAVLGNDVYAGGSFKSAGGRAANYIAKWNGSNWINLDSGLNSGVFSLAASGRDVYAGGVFTTSEGNWATNIAKWDGNGWLPLGAGDWGKGIAGSHPTVSALAVLGGDLYAGGDFTLAGGTAANRIAKWNGSAWTALGSGMNDSVSALAVLSNNVYAGGSFTSAGGRAANRIAKWNGSTWTNLGAGLNNMVSALAVSDSDLYAGGEFTTAGGRAASYIAKWNGSTWTNLGAGLNSGVSALAASGSDVYAGGHFSKAGGISVTNIAKWNGSSWMGLSSGVNRSVYALAVSGSDLYAGGFFTMAGGKVSAYVAKAAFLTLTPPLLHSVAITGGVFNALFVNTPGASFSGLASTNLGLPMSNWTVAGSVTEFSPGQFWFRDSQATNSLRRYYRIRTP